MGPCALGEETLARIQVPSILPRPDFTSLQSSASGASRQLRTSDPCTLRALGHNLCFACSVSATFLSTRSLTAVGPHFDWPIYKGLVMITAPRCV